MNALLEVTDLRILAGERRIVTGTSFSIAEGAGLGLVGESGSGKSMTARSLLRLLPAGFHTSGDIRFGGRSVSAMSRQELSDYRSHDVGMIFQNPVAHTNPVRTVGAFLTELPSARGGRGSRRADIDAAVTMLAELGIDRARERLRRYPHELSGGMLQRVMIAAALLREPRLLIADEPTTALDVTTQAGIMARLQKLRLARGLSLLFITHDLELAAATCDEIAVMYAGRIVEQAPASALAAGPRHPYTAALLRSRPRLDRRVRRLEAISGAPISAHEATTGCAFAPRCPLVVPRCRTQTPERRRVGPSSVACHRAEEMPSGPLEVGRSR